MRFRTRVLVLLLTLAVATNGVLLAMMYFQAREHLLRQMQTTVLSIAATAATSIDAAKHQMIKTRADEETPAYHEIETALRKVRDANRRPGDLTVKYVYTMTPHPTEKGVGLFAVDAEENDDDKSHVGDVYKARGDNGAIVFDQFQVQPGFVEDQWGKWLTANAPIRDANGKSVGVVGVDVDAAEPLQKINLLLWSGGTAMALSILLATGMAIVIARLICEPLGVLRRTAEAVGKGDLTTRAELPRDDEFGEVAQSMNSMIAGLRQRENLKGTLARYVSSELAEKIFQSGEMPELKGDRCKITVLFADLRGFTTIAETLNPEQVVSILNEFFEKMIEAIFRHGGTLNKFLGDGFMAVFGAPAEDNFQEEHAVRAALDMRRALDVLCERWKLAHSHEFNVGIGINTGTAVVGNIGSQQRMEYTAVGDAVNIAARLETASKELGTDIVVSEYTYVTVRHRFPFKQLKSLHVKGRTDPVTVYGVENSDDSLPMPADSASQPEAQSV